MFKMSVNLRDFKDNEKRMAALEALPKADYAPNVVERYDAKDIVGVDMYEAGVVDNRGDFSVIGTTALATCIGVAVHNPKTKATGVCHVVGDGARSYPSPDSEDALVAMLKNASGPDYEPLEARLVGAHMGGELNNDFLNRIYDLLAEFDTTVLSADVKGKPGPKDFAVDAANWEQGLIRGSVDMVDFRADPNTGGFAEMIKQKMESVDLTNMRYFETGANNLVYSVSPQSTPAPGYEL